MADIDEDALPPQTWLERNRQGVTYLGIILGLVALGAIFIATTPAATWGTASGAVGHPLTLLVDPTSGKTVYVGTEAGKIFSSGDNGQTWLDQSTGLPANLAVSALLRSNDGTRFLAGTSAGVFTLGSDNHWAATSTGLPSGDGVDALTFAGANNAVTLAGTELNGIYRSTDSGKTWTAASGLPDRADVYDLNTLPDGQTVYAALIGAGIFRSTDGGQTWAAQDSGIPAKTDAFAVVGMTDTNGKLRALLAGTSAGLFRSTDGTAWTATAGGLPKTRIISLGPDPGHSPQVLAGTDAGVFVSNDVGVTWRTLAKGLPSGQHIGAVAINAKNAAAYAAGDALYRYPAASNAPQGLLGRLCILGALVTTFVWVSARQRRTLRTLTASLPAEMQRPGAVGRMGAPERPTPTRQTGATGHIRGGPPPRLPDPPAEAADE